MYCTKVLGQQSEVARNPIPRGPQAHRHQPGRSRAFSERLRAFQHDPAISREANPRIQIRGKGTAQLLGITFESRGSSQTLDLRVHVPETRTDPVYCLKKSLSAKWWGRSGGSVGHYRFDDGLCLGASLSHPAVVVYVSIQLKKRHGSLERLLLPPLWFVATRDRFRAALPLFVSL